jgi:hypothetical protein
MEATQLLGALLLFVRDLLRIVNLRPGGAIRGKQMTVSWEESGVWYGNSTPPRLLPRLSRLRTDGLTLTINYWMYWSHAGDMDPVNWCSLLPLDACLSPLLQWLWGREKLDGDPQIGQPTCLWCSQEFLFLRSSDSIQCCWWLTKGCHI